MSQHDDHVVLTLRGELSLQTAFEVQVVLGKLLLDHGSVLADLEGLALRWAPAVEVFPAALSLAGGWPAVRLVLVGADDDMAVALHAARVPLVVPLAPPGDTGLALLQVRPPRVSRRAELPAVPEASRWARTVARAACRDWALPEVADDAALVATELVTNAVEHARTSSVLTVGLNGTGLHISVRDFSPATADRVRSLDAFSAPGNGLFIVARLSRGWGVTTAGDSKAVWAVLAVPDDMR